MIIEVNTDILRAGKINLNQLIFLSLVLDKNQKSNQDVREIVSQISDDEILDLIDQQLIFSIEREDSSTEYYATDKLKEAIKKKKDYFDLFYEMYPVYVTRPDGSKNYLRANVNKCRHLFNLKVGNSSAMAEHIIKCLDFEISKKMREGKLSYMMTMWNWLSRNQWEAAEEEMSDTENKTVNAYGTELI